MDCSSTCLSSCLQADTCSKHSSRAKVCRNLATTLYTCSVLKTICLILLFFFSLSMFGKVCKINIHYNARTETKRLKRSVLFLVFSILDFLTRPGPNFIIKDLPSVLILIIAEKTSNDSLCCCNKYN